MNAFRALVPALGIALASCGSGAETPAPEPVPRVGSPNARPELVEEFRRDLAAERHASDGGGRAWLAEGGDATASAPGRWVVAYEAGPEGVAVGGAVFLQVSPFWGWDVPQTLDPAGPGFTRVTCEAEDVALLVPTGAAQPLRVEIAGRALREGERILFDYGAGAMGARADLYAESASRFWIAVDGDGDGVRGVLADSPTVRVLPGPAERVVATLTSSARPGEPVELTLAILDRYANAEPEFAGEVRLGEDAAALGFPESVTLAAEDRAHVTLRATAAEPGVFRVRAETDFAQARSNPLRVAPDAEPLLWADLHGHSSWSDGTGTPTDYLAYARDVAALDVVALTDHDHYGILFLDAHEDRWREIERATAEFDAPGEFVTLLGYEWTNWIHGHRHVLWFEEHGTVHSSLSEEADTPTELWDLLRGSPALTIAHHSAGDPVATDWTIAPDPELEPVTEISSVHGSSEAADSPARVSGFRADNSVRAALERGYRLGFVGSGDSHDGHPGLPHLSPSYGFRPARGGRPERVGTGGLAALHGAQATRASVLETLRARRVHATSGPRILLDARLGEHAQGASVAADRLPERVRVTFRVHGTAALERIDLVRSGAVVETHVADGEHDLTGAFELRELGAGEHVYLRVVQVDGGLAWSSPTFVE